MLICKDFRAFSIYIHKIRLNQLMFIYLIYSQRSEPSRLHYFGLMFKMYVPVFLWRVQIQICFNPFCIFQQTRPCRQAWYHCTKFRIGLVENSFYFLLFTVHCFTLRPDAAEATSSPSQSRFVDVDRGTLSARRCAPSLRSRDTRTALDWLRWLVTSTALGRKMKRNIG